MSLMHGLSPAELFPDNEYGLLNAAKFYFYEQKYNVTPRQENKDYLGIRI